jgi:hypothetical protein
MIVNENKQLRTSKIFTKRALPSFKNMKLEKEPSILKLINNRSKHNKMKEV